MYSAKKKKKKEINKMYEKKYAHMEWPEKWFNLLNKVMFNNTCMFMCRKMFIKGK